MALDIENHKFDREILRQYDIRGIVGKNLNPIDAQTLGNILAQIAKNNGGTYIVVGYDGRLSSPELFASFQTGVSDYGVNCYGMELCATPELYFAGKIMGGDGHIKNNTFTDAPFAVMITGSHNPKEYNGFKMVQNGQPFWGPQIQELTKYTYKTMPNKGIKTQDNPIHEYYTDYILQKVRLIENNKKIVWDLGNGALCPAFAFLIPKLKKLGLGEHILLFEQLDGTFPNHHPDPTVEKNLAELKLKVKENKADFGVAFDGDGDRIGVIDRDGVVIWGDQLLAILARPILQNNPGATIIADVKASQAFFDEINNLGGRAVMAPTGHSIIKSKMAETGALLAGEMSGHIFFKDRWFGFDDALYAALRLWEICITNELSTLRQNLPQYCNTPEIRIDVDEAIKFKLMIAIKKYCDSHAIIYNDCDGVRARETNGWWLVRASNTQNCLVLRAEGKTQGDCDNYERRAKKIIEQAKDLL